MTSRNVRIFHTRTLRSPVIYQQLKISQQVLTNTNTPLQYPRPQAVVYKLLSVQTVNQSINLSINRGFI